MADYSAYINFINSICDRGDISTFKSNETYRGILEHVSAYQGEQYLYNIRLNTKITMDEVRAFCELNDSVGQPLQATYADSLKTSPTSLRYVYHSHVILSHFKSVGAMEPAIVEVGGGYGGLCLALHTFAPHYGIKIRSYTILDLDAPLRLQQSFLEKVGANVKPTFVSASTFGADLPPVDGGYSLVSNYCFSEIAGDLQKEYMAKLFPKVSHGFMVWNHIPLFDFGIPLIREEKEVPKTGPLNKYLFF